MEGMHAGADDYITKPVDLDELDARLEASRRVVLVQRRGSTRIPAVRAEPLTIPACRQEFAEDLETLASRVRRHTYCVAICNIDAFSSYNDCSDDVLGTVAETIRAALRPGDGFYRYGEDEFLAILTDQSLAEAAAGMDRVRREVAELHVVHSAQGSVPFVTLSVGIAELLPDSPCGIDDWLRQADFALYRAKAHHGNRVVVESQAEAHRLDAAAAR
jgi:diguanylate cyclase (GGDEF)-like protein